MSASWTAPEAGGSGREVLRRPGFGCADTDVRFSDGRFTRVMTEIDVGAKVSGPFGIGPLRRVMAYDGPGGWLHLSCGHRDSPMGDPNAPFHRCSVCGNEARVAASLPARWERRVDRIQDPYVRELNRRTVDERTRLRADRARRVMREANLGPGHIKVAAAKWRDPGGPVRPV
jgi:hypothetical protein